MDSHKSYVNLNDCILVRKSSVR